MHDNKESFFKNICFGNAKNTSSSPLKVTSEKSKVIGCGQEYDCQRWWTTKKIICKKKIQILNSFAEHNNLLKWYAKDFGAEYSKQENKSKRNCFKIHRTFRKYNWCHEQTLVKILLICLSFFDATIKLQSFLRKHTAEAVKVCIIDAVTTISDCFHHGSLYATAASM